MIALTVKNLAKGFGDERVLEQVDFSIEKNTFVSLVGPSGCGKTTLLKILAGILTNFSGTLLYHDRIAPDGYCALAFQDSPLFPWLSILDNIVISMNAVPLSEKRKKESAMSFLEKVQLAAFCDYYPYELSGGMIQRVNVVRSFAVGAEMIYMDEPFVHLDFLQRLGLQEMTLDMSTKEKRTILFVTHNIHEAVTLSDRVLLMSSAPGRIIKDITIPFARPRDVRAIREDPSYRDIVKDIMDSLQNEVIKSQRQYEQWLKEKRK